MDIVAVNVHGLVALREDGTVCEITNLVDFEGSDTNDVEEAVAVVIHHADIDQWEALDLADFVDPQPVTVH